MPSIEFFCKCGSRLPENARRCNSCGHDPLAAVGAPPAESVEARLQRLERGEKKSVAAKIKGALGVG